MADGRIAFLAHRYAGMIAADMGDPALDNPIYESLSSHHRGFALGNAAAGVLRYPAEIAPFVGVASAGMQASAGLEELVAPGESAYLVGVAPAQPEGWRLQDLGELAQMACTQFMQEIDGPELLPLDATHQADVLALTALVYPHYFRPRTVELGRYFGIYQDGRLAAIIGERMATARATEISAVCTHPDFNGRGYARRLLAWLSNDLMRKGRMPFLHVSHQNPRARDLYARCGYQHRRDIPFFSLQRLEGGIRCP